MEANATALPKDNTQAELESLVQRLGSLVATMPTEKKFEVLNGVKERLRQFSPNSHEPIDCVKWVPSELVVANDYNPNSVAPPEMRLLELSIKEDGYTQPIVTFFRDGIYEVVDGFHRNRVGKESLEVRKRVNGFLPVVVINDGRTDVADRMASTVRHNRARGKHSVDAMSDMVIELKRRNRSDEWIAKHLGMDPDEVLRLCQISGLTEMFADQNFSEAWDVGIFDDETAEGQLIEDTTEEQDEE